MNQNTRLLLAVALIFGFFSIWSRFVRPPVQRQALPTQQGHTTSGENDTRDQIASGDLAARDATDRGSSAVEAHRLGVDGSGSNKPTTGEIHNLFWSAGKVKLRVGSHGGVLVGAQMTDPRFTELRDGTMQPIELVQTHRGQGPWPLYSEFTDANVEIPNPIPFRLVTADAKVKDKEGLHLRWESAGVRIDKVFKTVASSNVAVGLDITVTNLGSQELSYRLKNSMYTYQPPTSRKKAGMTNPYPKVPTALCMVNGEVFRRSASSVMGASAGCSQAGCSSIGKGLVSQTGAVNWVGTDNRYFIGALLPDFSGESIATDRMRCDVKLWKDDPTLLEVSLASAESRVKAGEIKKHVFQLFLGEKDLSRISKLMLKPGQSAHLDRSIDFGMFAVLSHPILALLKFFHAFLRNWGLAIILLTVVIKLITLYWTGKSMRSMRKMQQLKPEIDALKKKFSEDKMRLNQETMALYRQHKVNPLGGCLPMLIQMPIWFALYRTLGNAQELYHSPFLGWIQDLTSPDRYFVLPILMGLAMFAQQSITPQSLDAAQARMMKFIMPVIFTFMMLWLPAGLTLYILVNTLLSFAHQYHMNKSMPLPSGGAKSGGPIIDAASTEVVEMPSGSTTSSKSGQKKGGQKTGTPKNSGQARRRKSTGPKPSLGLKSDKKKR